MNLDFNENSKLVRAIRNHPCLALFSFGSLSSGILGLGEFGVKKAAGYFNFIPQYSLEPSLLFSYLPAGLAIVAGFAASSSQSRLDEIERGEVWGASLIFAAGSGLTAYGINYLSRILG